MQTASAYPALRARFHNNFEMTHRFAGWLAVALVWGLVVSMTKDFAAAAATAGSLGGALVKTCSFWFLVTITACLVYPWLHLRKLDVHTEVLSSHACRIHVHDRSYVTPHPGSFVRLSLDPLFEWHSFAAIRADPDGGTEPGRKSDYSVVVSRAGDWTSNVIANPPTKMWYRGVPSMSPCRECLIWSGQILTAI